MSVPVDDYVDYRGHRYLSRKVATVHVAGGDDYEIWATHDDAGFLVTEGSSRAAKPACHTNTIKQAIGLALRNAGWG